MCGFILGLRGMVVIRGWWMERIGLILFRGLLYFPPPPHLQVGRCKVIFSNARPSLSFTLHGVRSNFKTRMGIRSCHGGAGADEIISQKSGQTALHFKSFAS